jgi:hypothetical protein
MHYQRVQRRACRGILLAMAAAAMAATMVPTAASSAWAGRCE